MHLYKMEYYSAAEKRPFCPLWQESTILSEISKMKKTPNDLNHCAIYTQKETERDIIGIENR